MSSVIHPAPDFVFQPAHEVSRARRVLIKPAAAYPLPYPVTTSRETLAAVIRGLRRVSDADIVLLEGPAEDEHARSVYRTLGYDFPRVLGLDVRDCTLVEVENPLPKPYALANFWVPNVVLSCDYLISVTPFKVAEGQGWFSVANLLGLLPQSKYGDGAGRDRGLLGRANIQSVLADLYFTLPFDLGIVDARMKFSTERDPTKGAIEEYGKIFEGEPFDVDCAASRATDTQTGYLRLIATAKTELEAQLKS
ncbi:MAG: DUF362 domain-containing protein [Chloroflexi bacterium]|nr:DUF362 domain-containing protein [Chloroflexota bacterium]